MTFCAFFVSMIFAAFSTAGQFFAFQMGFSAASAFDSLSQVENPLMGQYFNFIGILVFPLLSTISIFLTTDACEHPTRIASVFVGNSFSKSSIS